MGTTLRDRIVEQQARRLAVLCAIYEHAPPLPALTFAGLAALVGLPEGEVRNIWSWLAIHELVQAPSTPAPTRLRLIASGAREVERALSQPDRPTEHFSVSAIRIVLAKLSAGARPPADARDEDVIRELMALLDAAEALPDAIQDGARVDAWIALRELRRDAPRPDLAAAVLRELAHTLDEHGVGTDLVAVARAWRSRGG